jgi:hypothetical protein
MLSPVQKWPFFNNPPAREFIPTKPRLLLDWRAMVRFLSSPAQRKTGRP